MSYFYPKKIKLIDINANDAITFGIPRSGTTLFWNIIKDVLNEYNINVIKTHTFEEQFKENKCFIIVRDIRDALISQFRVYVNDSSEPKLITLEEFLKYENEFNEHFKHLIPFLQCNQHYVFKYEEFIHNHNKLYNQLEILYDISIPINVRTSISEKYKENNVKNIIKNINSIDEKEISVFEKTYDKQTEFHAMHIFNSSGKSMYDKYMDPKLVEYINYKYSDYLKQFSYLNHEISHVSIN
jgi:hypothetical protein